MANHFDLIADQYNQAWHFSDSYRDSMLSNIIESLQLVADDILADLGGGTGSYTLLLKQTAGLKRAYCIEPSAKMVAEAKKMADIESFCADAAEFLSLDLPYTKVLMKEMVHHVPSRPRLWNRLMDKLPPEGKILIVTRPQNTALPLFDAAKQAFRDKQPSQQTLTEELEASGFATSCTLHPYHFSMAKENWFELIRMRFMSDLGHFSDAEIEKGLREIDAAYDGNNLEIIDNILHITAWKADLRPAENHV